jgi:hypothetical protein
MSVIHGKYRYISLVNDVRAEVSVYKLGEGRCMSGSIGI